ncbi:MAG: 4-alpha-glucanotransferase [Planctomycetota bacterium]
MTPLRPTDARRAGVLAHPTSLPGPFGQGDLGPATHAFVARLAAAGQRLWQVLPLGPPGYGGSPYAAASAFAGDPLLISPERLVDRGLLPAQVLERRFPEGAVAGEASAWRRDLLRQACATFHADKSPDDQRAFAAWREAERDWLAPYALFTALRRAEGEAAHWTWPRARRPLPHQRQALRAELALAVEDAALEQWLFAEQWDALLAHAHAHGVEVMGDAPIFVARDSADVWAQPELFLLDAHGEPEVIAGVPPDYFSPEGQRWGNPLYDWAVHARTGYAWWVERMRQAFARHDWVRIDHFRGFASYWEVPASAETAVDGRWVPGPGPALFAAIEEALGPQGIVAEDLGELTPDVPALLEVTGFPGMKVLQFAWDEEQGAEHPFLPANYPEDGRCVVYTGTHDNQTTAGWYAGLDAKTKRLVDQGVPGDDKVWGLLELGWRSRAFMALAPLQDLLGLGDEARLNTPGKAEGNWAWRATPAQLDALPWERLRELTQASER